MKLNRRLKMFLYMLGGVLVCILFVLNIVEVKLHHQRSLERETQGQGESVQTEERLFDDEDLETAWNNRLGDYGIELKALPVLSVYEEVCEMTSIEQGEKYTLTIYGLRVDDSGYDKLNAFLDSLVEEEKRMYEKMERGLIEDIGKAFVVTRLDGRVCSVKDNYYENVNNAATFDMVTEQEIQCEDVFLDVKSTNQIIAEDLQEAIRTCLLGLTNEEKEQCLFRAQNFDLSDIESYQWYMDGENIVLIFPWVRYFSVHIPYREYAFLIKPEYLPGEGIAYYRSNNVYTDKIMFQNMEIEVPNPDWREVFSNRQEARLGAIGYYINDGTGEYLCVLMPDNKSTDDISYLYHVCEGELEMLKEYDKIHFWSAPAEFEERINRYYSTCSENNS